MISPADEYIDHEHSTLKAYKTAVKVGIYVEQLENWLQYFPLKQIHIVDGDVFVKGVLTLVI